MPTRLKGLAFSVAALVLCVPSAARAESLILNFFDGTNTATFMTPSAPPNSSISTSSFNLGVFAITATGNDVSVDGVGVINFSFAVLNQSPSTLGFLTVTLLDSGENSPAGLVTLSNALTTSSLVGGATASSQGFVAGGAIQTPFVIADNGVTNTSSVDGTVTPLYDWGSTFSLQAPAGAGGNFTVATSINPEPASLTLFSLGVVGIIGYSIRRRKQAA